MNELKMPLTPAADWKTQLNYTFILFFNPWDDAPTKYDMLIQKEVFRVLVL